MQNTVQNNSDSFPDCYFWSSGMVGAQNLGGSVLAMVASNNWYVCTSSINVFKVRAHYIHRQSFVIFVRGRAEED
eukprot:scaffold3827_cov179-Cylindrotheca_fusiformis.AAC.33